MGPVMSPYCLLPWYAGGGNGWGVRKWGAAADNVLAFQAVLPQPVDQGGCQLIDATADSHPDLFAGLKGAGQS